MAVKKIQYISKKINFLFIFPIFMLGLFFYRIGKYSSAQKLLKISADAVVKNKIIDAKIMDIESTINSLVFTFRVKTKYSLTSGEYQLKIKARENFDRECDVTLDPIKVSKFKNKLILIFNCNIDQLRVPDLYSDFFLSFAINFDTCKDAIMEIKASKMDSALKYKLKDFPLLHSVKKDKKIIYPYITAGGKNIALINRDIDVYDQEIYREREIYALNYFEKNKDELCAKKVWLICEKFCKTAQDNGYFFFLEVLKKRKNIYYVIEKNSPDRVYLENFQDNVVEFMSIKHMILLLSCEKLISSETRGHFYAWRRCFGKFREALFGKYYVFLQHGVTAMKKNNVNLSKSSHICAAAKFVVSSEFEKNIIIENDYGYDASEIIVSGFPRWKGFVDKSNDRNEVFLMPTWRNWLENLSDDEFVNSDYYITYSSLLASKTLLAILEENNAHLNFYLHPKIINKLSNFFVSDDRISLIDFSDVTIRELLMRAKVLVTDYSSVAWDFYYLRKPVLFNHFDLDRYTKFHGSHIDLKSDLKGEKVTNNEDLLARLSAILKEYPIFKNKAETYGEYYFWNIDVANSSDFIFNEIK
jgi:hypothetical protein